MRLSLSWPCAAAALMAVAGCGGGSGDSLPREAVSGKVTIDGQPLDEGQITFVSTDPNAPAVGGTVATGAYSISRSEGPVPGSYTVSVFSPKPTGKKIKDEADPNVTYDERAETIPEKYNAKSELKAEVKAGGGNTFDFDLKGRLDPTKPRGRR